MKGRVSKWLHGQVKLTEEQKLLSRGYFACTTGTSTAQAVDAYLEGQGKHHGYASRPRPPVFVARYPLTPAAEDRLTASHATTILRFHLVLSTWRRKGVFGRPAAEAIAARWRHTDEQFPAFIEKVSFVPDHVHLAVRTHPSVSPAALILALMNASQELMWDDYADSAIQAEARRLWQAGAYVGSYGNLESPKIAAYVRKWEHSDQDRR
jgi:REP element-mobilizing transposase RayT